MTLSCNSDPAASQYGWVLFDGVNTYVPIKQGAAGGYGTTSIWAAKCNFTGTLTTDFFAYSISEVVPGTGLLQANRMNLSFPACQIMQFSGEYDNPVNAFATGSGNSATASEAVTTSQSGQLVVGIAIPSGGTTLTESAGWTNAAGPLVGGSAIYAIEGAAGSYSPTYNVSPSSSWGIISVSFKSAATSASHTVSGSLGSTGAAANVIFISTTTAIVYSTTADGTGAYTSPALADDTYVIIPQKVGVIFANGGLQQAETTVSGSNVTGVNFTTSTVTTNLIFTTTFTDTMTRADENPLSDGGNWTGDGGEIPPDDPQCQLLSNECVMSDATIYANLAGPWTGDGISLLTGPTFSNDQFAQFRIDDLVAPTFSAVVCVQVRTSGGDLTSYDLRFFNNGDRIYNR